MYVKDGKFVVMNKGKPYNGKLVGSKEALAANKAGDPRDHPHHHDHRPTGTLNPTH